MPTGNMPPRSKYTVVLSVVLIIQAGLVYWASRGEKIPIGKPLDYFPSQINNWQIERDYPIEQDIRDQLKADDMMSRLYTDPASGGMASLFVAYFKTQRTGQSPHSPKNCLPGAGWEPEATGFLDVPVTGMTQPIRINRFVVVHGDDRSVVLYWYQSPRRVIATEFHAKVWLVMDSIRYHRSDTALVRVTVPVTGTDDDGATRVGLQFVEAMFPVLKSYLPA
jgi:EpsI family protein